MTLPQQSYFTVVDDFAPIMIVRFRGQATDEDFRAYLDELERRLFEPQRYGYVLDFDRSPQPSMTHRRMQADWLSRHRDRIEQESYGTALVITQAAHRFVLSSILLLTRMPGRVETVATVEDGVRFVASGIVALGDPVPESAKGLLATAAAG